MAVQCYLSRVAFLSIFRVNRNLFVGTMIFCNHPVVFVCVYDLSEEGDEIEYTWDLLYLSKVERSISNSKSSL